MDIDEPLEKSGPRRNAPLVIEDSDDDDDNILDAPYQVVYGAVTGAEQAYKNASARVKRIRAQIQGLKDQLNGLEDVLSAAGARQVEARLRLIKARRMLQEVVIGWDADSADVDIGADDEGNEGDADIVEAIEADDLENEKGLNCWRPSFVNKSPFFNNCFAASFLCNFDGLLHKRSVFRILFSFQFRLGEGEKKSRKRRNLTAARHNTLFLSRSCQPLFTEGRSNDELARLRFALCTVPWWP